jgi:hypothetical protein
MEKCDKRTEQIKCGLQTADSMERERVVWGRRDIR